MPTSVHYCWDNICYKIHRIHREKECVNTCKWFQKFLLQFPSHIINFIKLFNVKDRELYHRSKCWIYTLSLFVFLSIWKTETWRDKWRGIIFKSFPVIPSTTPFTCVLLSCFVVVVVCVVSVRVWFCCVGFVELFEYVWHKILLSLSCHLYSFINFPILLVPFSVFYSRIVFPSQFVVIFLFILPIIFILFICPLQWKILLIFISLLIFLNILKF